MTFSDVVEAIQILSTDEKEEVQFLLSQYIREERREKIYKNFQLAQSEQKQYQFKFSADIEELKELLDE